jgi:NAD(P)-dependent dehydrogenase (short-subunit alcohol dehydrogenase family)
MRIIVIDGQGGGIGRNLVERLKTEAPNAVVIAVGTNSLATSAMIKAGANAGATGENAVIYNCSHADIITGPIGIILANSMLGEITADMALAVSGSCAEKVLVPVSKCHVRIAGMEDKPISKYIEETVATIKQLCGL